MLRRLLSLAAPTLCPIRRCALLLVPLLAALAGCGEHPLPTAVAPDGPDRLLVSTPGAYTQASAGGFHTCAVSTTGEVTCWGSNIYGQTDVPQAAQSGITQVSASREHTCALSTTGEVTCWGYNSNGQTDVPQAAQSGITQVSTSEGHTCALSTSGEVTCWGLNRSGQTDVPAAAQSDIAQVSVGLFHTCALSNAGEVICWGSNRYGQTSIPAAARSDIAQVSAGVIHTCALSTSGEVICWGDDNHGQTSIPAAARSGISQVSAGGYYICALSTSGEVICWGQSNHGQTSIPAAARSGITQVSAGVVHTCALSTSGEVICWGNNQSGQMDVPDAPTTPARVLPTATFTAPETVAVGQAFTLTLADAQVPGHSEATTFTYAFDCGDGYGEFGATSTTSCTASSPGQRTVKGKLRDQDGDSQEYTATLTVRALPTATFTAPETVLVGQPVMLTLADAQVPGSSGATIRYAFDCGGGVYSEASSSATTSCPTSVAGPLTVRGKVIDQDGGSQEYTGSVAILSAGEVVEALRAAVAAADLRGNVQRGLTSKLDAASAALLRGSTRAAYNQLGAFANQVRAQRGKAIPAETADDWLLRVRQIRSAISG